MAAIGDVVLGPVEGLQLAPFDLAGGGVHGAQIGVVTIAGAPLQGAQIGTVNLAAGAIEGAQIGTTNVAASDVTGAQIGVVNIAAGRVNGTQIGLVNYADDSDASIGLLSFVRHGRTDLEAWGTESGLALGGVRHGHGVLHNIYGAGLQLGGKKEWALALGLGFHAPLSRWLTLDIDLIETWLQKGAPYTGQVQLATVQGALAVPLGRVVEVFAAPTFNVLVGDDRGTGLAPPWPTFDFYDGQPNFVRGWIGLSGGLRVKLWPR
jgi:hypothetical protein